MQCSNCVDLLYDYLDDELDQEERLFVESHLNVCGACQKEWQEIQLAVAAYRGQFNAVSAGPQFTERVMTSLSTESEPIPTTILIVTVTLLLASFAIVYAIFSPLIYPMLRLVYRLAVSLAPLPAMMLSAFPLLLYGGMAVLAIAFLTLTWATRRVVLS